MDKASANFNMQLDNGSFERDQPYSYVYENDKVFVTTREGNIQEFTPAEFDMLFTLLTI